MRELIVLIRAPFTWHLIVSMHLVFTWIIFVFLVFIFCQDLNHDALWLGRDRRGSYDRLPRRKVTRPNSEAHFMPHQFL